MNLSATSTWLRRSVSVAGLCAFLVLLLVAREGTAPAAAAAVCNIGDVTVAIQGSAFQPAMRTISSGQTVCWTNQDSLPHTATSDTGAFNSPTLNQGDTFRHTFSQGGSFPYHCVFHPFMTGTIRVLPRRPRVSG